MVTTGTGLAANLAALVGLLAALTATGGLGAAAWAVGVACGLVVGAAVVRGLAWGRAEALGPADLVTLARLVLTCGLAALVAESFLREPARPTVAVVLAGTALLLDAVDGPVARRTRTTSVFGARFDGEADAFLLLVLSAYVARSAGAWVLVIGALRYAFAVAGWALPWLQEQLPHRYWRKVVTAIEGVVLTIAAADVVPQTPTYVVLVVALGLLVESFGRDVLWLWLHRFGDSVDVTGTPAAFRLRPP
ncbi:MAG TPA: CDP-alcohol phosphatidyltransferase family protein [Nocardioides sp.]|nr:CDP-alcohol phosphatidyltransferase family protein [Nocardioides sp.]